MKNFRTFNLAVNFYKQTLCQKIPAHLKQQLLRAASSIALNLAEGRGKATTKDQVKFFHIALGSLRECEAILILANLERASITEELNILGAHLFKRARVRALRGLIEYVIKHSEKRELASVLPF